MMLPIKRVILYKHGVGYFEREGQVKGDAALDLTFKANEMNDVLKSLTLFDLNGGVVSSISYESTKPIERQLEDIAIHLPDHQALTGLLDQIKGARVSVEAGSSKIEGAVSGTETVVQKSGEDTVTKNFLILLVGGQSLETFDLFELKSIVLLDDNLKKDLQYLLDTLISGKRKDAKKLTIFAKGKGERKIVASYVVETPVWKTSYRLVLPSSQEKDKKGVLVQGWALVDNTQDEDWDDVSLSLVCGLPVSFIHDLYSPRYKRRPIVAVHEEEAYGPPVLEEGFAAQDEAMPASPAMEMADMEMSAKSMPAGAAGAPARSRMAQGAPMSKKDMSRGEARVASAPVQTRTVEVGDLFQYAIENQVTVKRNQSALVPILQANSEGKRVAVYNREIREKNPMSCILLKNTTSMTLEGGPAMVMEDDSYVGEAMLDTFRPGEERLVPYSVELGCTVAIENNTKYEDVRFARIYGGYLYLYRYRISETTYVVNNKSDRPIDLFLEHRFIQNWELVDKTKLYEKTDNFYRFRIDVPPKKATKFVVNEKGDESETYYITQTDTNTVDMWLSKKYIDAGTKKKLIAILEVNKRINELNSTISNAEQEVQNIFAHQQRLRENLQALGESREETKLRERYVSELNQQEDRLAVLNDKVNQMKSEKEQLEQKVAKQISEINFETKL
jgi:hypothetical protein